MRGAACSIKARSPRFSPTPSPSSSAMVSRIPTFWSLEGRATRVALPPPFLRGRVGVGLSSTPSSIATLAVAQTSKPLQPSLLPHLSGADYCWACSLHAPMPRSNSLVAITHTTTTSCCAPVRLSTTSSLSALPARARRRWRCAIWWKNTCRQTTEPSCSPPTQIGPSMKSARCSMPPASTICASGKNTPATHAIAVICCASSSTTVHSCRPSANGSSAFVSLLAPPLRYSRRTPCSR